MTNEDAEFRAELLREFAIFFAVLFLTCVVGIIELLSEFEKINGLFGWISISSIYFGLLFGIVYSMDKCFWLYEQNRMFSGKFGYNYPDIEYFILKIFKSDKNLEGFLVAVVTLIFIMLYLVKIGLLR